MGYATRELSIPNHIIIVIYLTISSITIITPCNFNDNETIIQKKTFRTTPHHTIVIINLGFQISNGSACHLIIFLVRSIKSCNSAEHHLSICQIMTTGVSETISFVPSNFRLPSLSSRLTEISGQMVTPIPRCRQR